jgi:dihydroxyacetone kinase-like predicted kinase
MLESLRLAGVVDAGGRGVVLLLDALTAVWNNQDVDSPPVGFVPTSVPHAHECDADARFELMFHIPADRTDEIRAAIAAHGLSLAITRGHDISQVHIHVDSPHDIIERASAIAEVRNVRIELLEEVELTRKVVVQAFGSGVVQMLAESGAVIVAAEPDERPSVHDFYAAGLRANANEIIILPGDKDSISVAKLAAAELTGDGKTVEVIPTQTLIHSLTAMSVHDVSKDFATDIADMNEAVTHVMSVGISVAARDSETPLGSISQGDFLGFLNADLKSVSKDIVDAVCSVALAAHTGELITMIIGCDIPQSDVDDVTDALMTMFPHAEIIAHAGRQEVWQLMVGIE